MLLFLCAYILICYECLQTNHGYAQVKSNQITSVFTYGSLMCEDIMFSIVGPCERQQQASLSGYQRRPVRGETYPGITPLTGASVSGIVYSGINNDALRALDRFEGAMYQRCRVKPVLQGGLVTESYAYITRPEFAHLLENTHWDFDEFLRHGKSRFISMYSGFVQNESLE